MFWFSRRKQEDEPVTGLVLPGGGARNAYQVGVLKAIAEILPEDENNPFPVITGTSSGAINAISIATMAGQYRESIGLLEDIWMNISVDKVFRTDTWTALKSGFIWTISMIGGGLIPINPKFILNNRPLRKLLETQLNRDNVQEAIDRGDLRAVGISASGYDSGMSFCYYQGIDDIKPWKRTQRCGIPCTLELDHLMASIAIPIIFPAVKVNGEYHGDGTMRESAPLSPALHLGANRLLIIGIQDEIAASEVKKNDGYPSVGQIVGYVLDTLFMDSLNADIERLNRINLTISETKDNRVEVNDTILRPIEFLVISPSANLGEVVERHVKKAPGSIRTLLRSMGALNREGHPLISYLLFESGFCRELIELGYQDGLKNREDILKLLCPETEKQVV